MAVVTMRPIALKGHERSITCIKYNRDGDLIFSSSKDTKPTVWYTDTGERLGTYKGHNGAIWSLDVSFDSTRLLSGSADTTARLWEVETGVELFEFKYRAPVRSVAFATGDKLFCAATDSVMGLPPSVFVQRLSQDPRTQESAPVLEITPKDSVGKINQALWGPLSETIVTANEDGSIRVYDGETGKPLQEVREHKKTINSFSFSKDRSHFITASADSTAKLFDTKTLKVLKVYEAEKSVNAAAISPLMPHIIFGGGQAAAEVTTTHSRVGAFQTRFFHKIFQEELGSIKGHFGPINALEFAPDGRSFASGAEDGYVRLHHFDENYFALADGERSRADKPPKARGAAGKDD